MEISNIKVIGLGGIGSILIDKIARYMTYSKNIWHITLIDGDRYESKNRQRQDFLFLKNKALSKQDELNAKFSNNAITNVVKEYVTPQNIGGIIKEKDLVFVCVDNHKTRKLISDYVSELDDIVVISGGNDYIDGNVQVYIREDGKDMTPPLGMYHPEIDNPTDNRPDELSCGELAKSEPQLYFVNLTVVTIMTWILYAIEHKKFDYSKSEVYFDIVLMSISTRRRVVKHI